ncbi:MAG: preprotein translocase subunit YajC [Firmicutes bacterium]|nr:preprotein translocase subunit YajC [Bacillota bacterium]
MDIKPFILPVAFLVIFYFLLIRPQQKKDKKIKEMRKNLKVGDKITTIGGIIGTIKKINDEQVVIEVGSDKTRFAITKWAVGNLVEDKEEKDK